MNPQNKNTPVQKLNKPISNVSKLRKESDESPDGSTESAETGLLGDVKNAFQSIESLGFKDWMAEMKNKILEEAKQNPFNIIRNGLLLGAGLSVLRIAHVKKGASQMARLFVARALSKVDSPNGNTESSPAREVV